MPMLTEHAKNLMVSGVEWSHSEPFYMSLHEDEAREKKWAKLLDDVPSFEGDEFDLREKDSDWKQLPKEPWRRPSYRRRYFECMAEIQERHARRFAKNPAAYQAAEIPGEPNARILESTLTSDIIAFPTQFISILRRVVPQMYVMDLVPFIQLSQPTGKLHRRDISYGSAQDMYAVGTRVDNNQDPDYSTIETECTNANELDLDITETSITTYVKKLFSTVSTEAEQNGEAYYRLSPTGELATERIAQMAREWQREIVESLRTNGTGGTSSFDKTVPAAAPWNALPSAEYRRTLWEAILDVEEGIRTNTYVSSNFLVMDEGVRSYLAKNEGYSLNPIGDGRGRTSSRTAINLFGQPVDMWDTYVDPFFVPDQILVGGRSSVWDATGFAMFTFIMGYQFPRWVDPRSGCIYEGVMDRAAPTRINDLYYGNVNLYAS